MSSGGSTSTQSVDSNTRNLGLLGYQNAQNAASQPFQNFDPSMINQYMSPYVNDVVKAGTADLNKQRDMTLQQNASQQTAQHAFGGDRSSVMDALTNNDFTSQIASFDANTRNTAYGNAQNVAMENWKAKEMYPMLWQGLLNGAFGDMVGNTATRTTNTSSSPDFWGMLGTLGGDALGGWGQSGFKGL